MLESTPLVLLANNRPRRRTRRTGRTLAGEDLASLAADEDLSDDSLQADAEVRSYMVEKSRLLHLGIRGPLDDVVVDAFRLDGGRARGNALVSPLAVFRRNAARRACM